MRKRKRALTAERRIRFENWYGEREGALEVPPRAGVIAGLESIFSGLLRRRYTAH